LLAINTHLPKKQIGQAQQTHFPKPNLAIEKLDLGNTYSMEVAAPPVKKKSVSNNDLGKQVKHMLKVVTWRMHSIILSFHIKVHPISISLVVQKNKSKALVNDNFKALKVEL